MEKKRLHSAVRICRFAVFRLILPLAGVAACLLLGLYLFCQFKQDYVSHLAEKHLRERTGLPFRVGGPVMPVFFPRPGVAVNNLRLVAADMSLERSAPPDHPLLSVKALEITLDLFSLVAEGHLAHIVLEEPLVTLGYAEDGAPLWVAPRTPRPEDAAPASSMPALDKNLWRLTTPLRIADGGLRMLDTTGEEVLEMRGLQATVNPDATMYPIQLRSAVRLLKGEMEVDCTLALGPAAAGDTLNVARGRLTGNLRLTPPGSRTLEAEVVSSLFLQKDGGAALPDFLVLAEGDSLILHLVMDPNQPSCSGKTMIQSLSLPRWFHFARNLPPGLQAPLHGISGLADLHVDAKSAAVTNLNLKAGELPVTGMVGVDDFAKPVVRVDVALDAVNLDEIFPFLALPDSTLPAPEEPVFDHPPLVPYPGPSASEDLPEVGYDVRVAAQHPIIHSLPAGPVDLKVFPRKEDTSVTFTCGELMKGAVDGTLDIGTERVGMVYNLKNVDLALLPENKGSSVQFHGRITGAVRIGIPVRGGHWQDIWKFEAGAGVDNLNVLVSGARPWHLPAKKADLSLDGSINSDRATGVYLEGLWKLDAKNVAPSWNPKASDAFTLDLNGRLSWPPVTPRVEHGRRVAERGGLARIQGVVASRGLLHAPLGRRQVPVSGTLTGNLDWNVDNDVLRLDKAALDGLGSYFAADLLVDMSGRLTRITADSNFKLNPRVFLKEWDLLPGGGAQVPANVSGTSKIAADVNGVDFGELALQIDGAEADGRVRLAFPPPAKGQPAEQLWTIRLDAEQLDLDNYFPPAKPEEAGKPRSTTPWDLSALQGVNLDAQVKLKRTRLRKLFMQDMLLSAALQRNRFTFAFQAGKLYDGSGVVLAQGALDPATGRITVNTANVELKGVSLGKALGDATGDSTNSYGGTAAFSAMAQGVMNNPREVYAGMSGSWSISIKDGIYPAFIGSETAGLRNTFSSASASGPLDKGVMRWDNFKLSGTMVDMNGDGMVDLGERNMDFTIYVTLAKVPTVPVRFQGSFDAPSMNLRGAHMIVHTAKAAGTTVFDIFMGVLELPGRAARGVGDLFGPSAAPAQTPGRPAGPASGPSGQTPAPAPRPAYKPMPETMQPPTQRTPR